MNTKPLSASTLFHYTSRLEYLKNILSNGFYPRYSLENLDYFLPEKYSPPEIALPMVCFCDIQFSQINSHWNKYGHYGLGLTKEWGKQNKINPILYSPENSSTSLVYKKLFNELLKISEIDNRFDKSFGKLTILLNFFKHYKGKIWKDGEFSDEIHTFYDEKEWRYVPYQKLENMIINEGLPARVYLKKGEFLNQNILQKHNELVRKNCSLSFNLEDVKYIIVKEEKEIDEVLKIINQNFPEKKETRLTNRIFTVNQILQDF